MPDDLVEIVDDIQAVLDDLDPDESTDTELRAAVERIHRLSDLAGLQEESGDEEDDDDLEVDEDEEEEEDEEDD